MKEQLELAIANAANATDETTRRLRWAFPNLTHEQLEAMASKHPEVKRERRYWLRRVYAIRRCMKTAKA